MKDPLLYPQKDTDHALALLNAFYYLEAKLLGLSPIKRFLFHHDEAYEFSRTCRDIVSFTNPAVKQVFSLRNGTLYY